MILLDTHILIRYATADRRLGKRASAAIDRRLKLNDTPMAFRALTLRQGITERPVEGEVAIRSAELPSLHADPADRIIAATAIFDGATLVTADAQLLGAKLDGFRVQDGTR